MLDERYPKHPLQKCDYCEMLRACEERVRLEDHDYAYVAAQAEADGRRRGWADALDAAREAVDGLDKYTHGQISAADALADIDALQVGAAPKD